jgi:hypothetical protein
MAPMKIWQDGRFIEGFLNMFFSGWLSGGVLMQNIYLKGTWQ